ncbi:CoA-binding protein, partial [Neisseria meningitidis]|uniref:CoA-binding protein n=1 Tax=Neisseria meningitidis TaxID=487 RepID=UPI00353161BB
MPNHIMQIGASDRPYSRGERVLSTLLSRPFKGKSSPVNPRPHPIAGLPAYA